MPKPDPALLDPARYPFRCNIETRFGDLDVNQHLNNVALVGLLEEGRVRFHRASGFHSVSPGMTTMIASIAIEFLGQSYFPAPLEMHVAPLRLGNTSYTLSQLAMQEGRIIAYAEATMVCMGDEGPTRLREPFRENMKAWMPAA